jgi:uncharacterized protein (TIRG00374 family)
MSKWIWAAASIVFLVVTIGRLAQIERLLRVASQGIWYFLLVALLLQGLFLLNQAAFYSSISRLTHQRLSTCDLLLPILAADFLEVATPTPLGNLPGVALIVNQAEQQGMSRTEATLMNVVYFVLDYTAFLVVLAVGLLHLYHFHDLKPYVLTAALSLSVLVGASFLVLLFALLHPAATCAWIGQVVTRAANWWFRLRRKPPPSGDSVAVFAVSLQGSIELLRGGEHRILLPVAHAFAVQGINLMILSLLFLAFRSPVSFGVLIAGYAVGALLVIISITPSGLGPVEGIMILTYSALGVMPEAATLVTLVYRGLSFWLPFVTGFVALRRLR